VRLYVYPFLNASGELVDCGNFQTPPGMAHLYAHLRENGLVRAIEAYRPEYLHIHSPEVLALISKGDARWESMVPSAVAAEIKRRSLFQGRPTGTAMFAI